MQEIKKLDERVLDMISGGKSVSGENFYDAVCPGCGNVYTVCNQLKPIVCPCGTTFTPTAR